jgi:hypothetical protein
VFANRVTSAREIMKDVNFLILSWTPISKTSFPGTHISFRAASLCNFSIMICIYLYQSLFSAAS